jgi:xylan 1,4-beta-xylosidase
MAGGGTSSVPAAGTAASPPAQAGATNAGGGGAAGGTANPPVPATCQGNFASVALEGAKHAVKVDPASSRGQLPHFWNTYGIGHLAAFLQQEDGWGATLKAHVIDGVQNLGLNSIRAHGLFHDDIGIYREENAARVYDFTRSDQIFDFLVQQGVAPIVELGSMPAALARDPSQVWASWKMGISPPKDFQLWQELVFKFVEHSVQRYGADVVSKWYFEVWNEPECCGGQFWKGTIEEYFELYDHAVAGVRAALPGARVGGPVASQPVELTENSEIGRKFLEHVTTDNYVTPGMPGHLDVLMFHTWSFIDGSVNGYFAGLELLSSFGLNDVGVAITEFGPTWEFNLRDEPQENEQGAAFVAQTYSDISQRCAREGKRFPVTYAWWTLSDIFKEDDYREEDPFIGAMGLISRENIRKPAYNAYRFLAQMGDQQVALTTNDSPGIGGMAARDSSGGVQVLIYNGQSPGNGPADDVYYTATEAQDIALSVSGLQPNVPYDVTAYRVDDTHGNAYSVWETLGRPTMPAMTQENWTALRDAMDSKPEPMAQSQCGSAYTGRFSVASPGVLFVKLTPTPPKAATP